MLSHIAIFLCIQRNELFSETMAAIEDVIVILVEIIVSGKIFMQI